MGKYEVAISVVSVPGRTRKVPRIGGLLEIQEPEYYRLGEVVELDDSLVKGHVAKGYLKPVSASAETTTEQPEPSPEATVGVGSTPETSEGTEGTGTGETAEGTEEPKLTEKQRLVKEAEELGLDSSGTVVELKSRIEQYKAGQ